MSKRPLVSVIMPAYNAEAFVADAIDSVLAQEYRPIEVLVADDGSTDGTAEVVKAYGEPVRCLRRENGGPAAARNTALREARGEYIAFLDADDLWHPRKLQVQIETMDRNPAVGISGGRMQSFRRMEEVEWSELADAPETRHISGETLLIRNRFSTSTVVARAEAVRQAGEFDEDIFGPEDWDMWRRITSDWNGLGIRAVLAAYREREASVSDNAARMLENNRKVLRKAFADNPGLPWWRKLKAISYLHFDAALEYGKESIWRAALELAKACAFWPLPGGTEYCAPFLRAKLAVRLSLHAVTRAMIRGDR